MPMPCTFFCIHAKLYFVRPVQFGCICGVFSVLVCVCVCVCVCVPSLNASKLLARMRKVTTVSSTYPDRWLDSPLPLSLYIYISHSLAQKITVLNTFFNSQIVFVSGLLAVGQTPTEAEINAAPTSCTGNRSDNLLSWLPSSNSVSTPSVCDGQ